MIASRFRLASRWASALALGALAFAGSACTVGVDPGYEPGAVYPAGSYPAEAYYDYPPDTYIATTAPVYFDGHASYWYGNRWYYRDGARWSYYHNEPAELARRRLAAPPARRTYEDYRGHSGAHAEVHGQGGDHRHH